MYQNPGHPLFNSFFEECQNPVERDGYPSASAERKDEREVEEQMGEVDDRRENDERQRPQP